MNISSIRLFQLFKYVVYTLLTINIYLFWDEESAAAALQFTNGIALGDVIEAYAATIDTAAWVVLLLMFELETYVLEDHHYNPTVTRTLKTVRALCLAVIAYAFVGYVDNLNFILSAAPYVGSADPCMLSGWSWGTTLDEFVEISAANCEALGDGSALIQFSCMSAVVDTSGYEIIRNLAWLDVINSAAWILVVLILEIDVQLQERNRYEGAALYASNVLKGILYTILLLAAVYWGIDGDFIDFWDAFLWLVAFFFIEMNVIEWRQEELDKMAQDRV